MSIIRNSEILGYFREHELEPAQIIHRYDHTLELSWHIDDDPDRYVRLTTSVNSNDCAIVARNHRDVEAVVLDDLKQMKDWVGDHLLRMYPRGVHVSDFPVVG